MQKYNLALLPQSKSKEVIQFAQYFSDFAYQYLLGNESLPHVTLYHFYYKESEIENLIKAVQTHWQEKPLYLKFQTFSCLTMHKEVYWVSLMPDHRDKLNAMHKVIADLIQQPIKDNFDPHMTLFNCENNSKEKMIRDRLKLYKLISDTFTLALGRCDNVGQFTEILHSF